MQNMRPKDRDKLGMRRVVRKETWPSIPWKVDEDAGGEDGACVPWRWNCAGVEQYFVHGTASAIDEAITDGQVVGKEDWRANTEKQTGFQTSEMSGGPNRVEFEVAYATI
jgi:hypothetical protein